MYLSPESIEQVNLFALFRFLIGFVLPLCLFHSFFYWLKGEQEEFVSFGTPSSPPPPEETNAPKVEGKKVFFFSHTKKI